MVDECRYYVRMVVKPYGSTLYAKGTHDLTTFRILPRQPNLRSQVRQPRLPAPRNGGFFYIPRKWGLCSYVLSNINYYGSRLRSREFFI